MMIQYTVRLKNQLNNYQSLRTVASKLDFLDCQSAKCVANDHTPVSILLLEFRAANTTLDSMFHMPGP